MSAILIFERYPAAGVVRLSGPELAVLVFTSSASPAPFLALHCSASWSLPGYTKLSKLCPCLLQIIVDNDLIMHSWSLCKLQLVPSLRQPLLDGFFCIRLSTPKPLLQNLDRRWLKEEKASVEICLLDLLYALRSALAHILDRPSNCRFSSPPFQCPRYTLSQHPQHLSQPSRSYRRGCSRTAHAR